MRSSIFKLMKVNNLIISQNTLHVLGVERVFKFSFYSAMIWKKKGISKTLIFITSVTEIHKYCS